MEVSFLAREYPRDGSAWVSIDIHSLVVTKPYRPDIPLVKDSCKKTIAILKRDYKLYFDNINLSPFLQMGIQDILDWGLAQKQPTNTENCLKAWERNSQEEIILFKDRIVSDVVSEDGPIYFRRGASFRKRFAGWILMDNVPFFVNRKNISLDKRKKNIVYNSQYFDDPFKEMKCELFDFNNLPPNVSFYDYNSDDKQTMYGLFLKILYQERAKLHNKSINDCLKSDNPNSERFRAERKIYEKYRKDHPLPGFKGTFEDPYLDFIFNDIACESEVFRNNIYIYDFIKEWF